MSKEPSFRTSPHLIGLITLVGRLLQEETGARLGQVDLTYAQAVALVRLWRTQDGLLPQATLTDSLALSRAAASQLLSELETRGLIVRETDPADARRQMVELTSAGRALEASAMRIFDSVEGELTAGMDSGERDASQRVLSQLLSQLRQPQGEAM